MSLLDDLRAAAHALDPQFTPSSNEVQKVLGALVHYAEHGDEFLKAAASSTEDVVNLLQPHVDEPEPAPPAAAPAPVGPTAPTVVEPAAAPAEVSDQELEAQIADLQAQRDARRATGQATQVTHETGAPADAPPPTPSKPGWLHRS